MPASEAAAEATRCGIWYYRYSCALMYCSRLEEALSYARNPFRPALSRWGMRCNGEDGKQVGASPSPYNLRGADARIMAFPLEAGISTAVITFAPYGRTAATLSLPISWEEVSHAS